MASNRNSHKTPFPEANEMINHFLEIRKVVKEKNLLRDEAPENVKNYFYSNILSFAFYKTELDKYFFEVAEKNPPQTAEQFGIRIYLAADTNGKPSLVMTLCKLIGTGTDALNVTSALDGTVPEHPRLLPGTSLVIIESGDKATCEPWL